MNERVEREQILLAYVEATDPAERRELLRKWINSGGRELIDDALSAGLESLRASHDTQD